MGVLDGVRVVELAEHGFVPSCGAILGDWGAEVIKIEKPAGDPLRAIMAAGLVADTGDVNFLWELYNRNKRGLALDLRVAEGRAVFDRLLEDADVLLTNFLPSARAKLRVATRGLLGGEPPADLRQGARAGSAGPRRRPGRVRRRLVLGPGRPRAHPQPPAGPDDHAAGRDGRRAERRHARRRRRRGAVPAGTHRTGRASSTSRCSTPRCGSSAWTSPPPRSSARTRGRCTPPASSRTRSSARTGPVTTRWLLLNMLDDTRHWAPTCRALGLDGLLDDARFADTAGRAEHRVELHAAHRRAHRHRRPRRAPAGPRGRGHRLRRAGVAARGHRRPAGHGQRLLRGASDAPVAAAGVRADAVRRRDDRDPPRRARHRRAQRRDPRRARLRAVTRSRRCVPRGPSPGRRTDR